MLDAIWKEANKFENVLQSLRVRRGKSWTQKSTAELLDVKYRLYVVWENGEGLPSPENLKKIVATFRLNQDEEEMLYRAAMRVPQKVRHLPFPPNPFFTGRKTYLEQLGQFLPESGTVALTQPVSISGLGGIGKTQLALAYAYLSYPKVYRVVLWVNAADRTMLQADYDTLAQKLGLPEQNEREPRRRVQAVKQWLDDHTHWLLIMDNADDLPLARSFFPEVNHGHILLTTRSQFAGKIGARQIEIDKMEPEEGQVFLLRRLRMLEADTNLDTVAIDIREPALQLVKLLDGHPLALDQSGAYIEETGVSFTEYINLYQKKRRDFLSTYGALDREPSEHPEQSQHPETVVVTFELCFTKARERHPLATEILHFCTFLRPDAMPEELFQNDDSFKLDALKFHSGIAALQRYSLIKHNTQAKTFSMHRLVQAVLIDTMSPDPQMQWRKRVVRALNAAFPEVVFEEWARCERLMPHVITWAIPAEGKLTLTSEDVRLLQKAGHYLNARGQYSAAELFLAGVLSIFEQHFEAEHPNIASALGDLANLYCHQGKYEQAEPLFWQALTIQEKYLGAEHPETARSLLSLGDIYFQQNKDEQAEQLLLRALSIREKYLGAEHPDTALSMYPLALLYLKQHKHRQAASLFLRSLSILEKHLGAEHPYTALPLYGSALVLHDLGQHEHAEVLYQRALSIHEQGFGATHPHIQLAKSVHADLLHRIGRGAEAVAQVNDEPSL